MNVGDEIRRFAEQARETNFNGADYVPIRDNPRLNAQIYRVFCCMIGGEWRTLDEIAKITNDPPASISAQLRHLRKERFGSYRLGRRHRSAESSGLYEYQLEMPFSDEQMDMFPLR